MVFPLLGWAAIAVGGAIAAAVISSDDDDSSPSSGTTTYKKSLDKEISKRGTKRKAEIKKGEIKITKKLWTEKQSELSKYDTEIVFPSKDATQLVPIINNNITNNSIIKKSYLAIVFNRLELEDAIQDYRTYIAIGGNIAELAPKKTVKNITFKNIELKKIKFTPLKFKEFAEYLNLFTSEELDNKDIQHLIVSLVDYYDVKGCLGGLSQTLQKYNSQYGEREGLESDNTYNESLDSAINKIRLDYK